MRYLDINWRPVFWELAGGEGEVSGPLVLRVPLIHTHTHAVFFCLLFQAVVVLAYIFAAHVALVPFCIVSGRSEGYFLLV